MRNTIVHLSLAAAIVWLSLIAVGIPTTAAPVGETKARRAVETWVRHVTAHKRPEASVERIEPHRADGAIKAYIVHLTGGGYCLAGADSLTLPVYWYCPTASYDPNNPACRAILDEIGRRASFLSGEVAKGGTNLAAHREALATRARMWEDLGQGKTTSSLPDPTPGTGRTAGPTALNTPPSPSLLELPLTSIWDQVAPYNGSCPAAPVGSANHTLVGCVATAMSQVMNYWRWPNTGTGTASVSYSYRYTGGSVGAPLSIDPGVPAGWNGGILSWDGATLWMTGAWDPTRVNAALGITNNPSFQSAVRTLYDRMPTYSFPVYADFGSTSYNWSLLQDSHATPPDTGGIEVAKLCAHAGIAVGMDYGLDSSGAYLSDVPGALVNHFRYDPDAFYTYSGDINAMVSEIRWQRPFILDGYNLRNGGHAWVVYGYNQNTSPWQFKMNMGWGGSSDGWYSMDKVPSGFTITPYRVDKIAPRDVVRFVGTGGSGDGSPNNPYQNIEEAVAHATDHATLIFESFSANTFSAPALTINRPLTLKGIQVTISK